MVRIQFNSAVLFEAERGPRQMQLVNAFRRHLELATGLWCACGFGGHRFAGPYGAACTPTCKKAAQS